ncbi:MAG: MATE family efflux transporter [Clostridia bacterium]|nr:MATE family efflux transporter [Clostridia bacterium]
MNTDLTSGSSKIALVTFTLPILASTIIQKLYQIADSVIVGKFAGEKALAAVGASYPITLIFMSIAFGSQLGCSVVISRFFGARDFCSVKNHILTTLIAGSALAVPLTLFGVLGSPLLMSLINTPHDIFPDGDLYLKIYTGGFVFLYLYNLATGIFNSLGDSRTPLVLLVSSSVCNVVLDIFFVINLKMTVAGVAWATFIAQGAACIAALLILSSRIRRLPITKPTKAFSFAALSRIAKISLPSIFQQSFVSAGNMFIQSIVNTYGYSVIAGYSAAIKLNSFVTASGLALGSGMSSFTAQNIGAKRVQRASQGFRFGLLLALPLAAAFFCAYYFFGDVFLSFFMNDAASLTAKTAGETFLRTVSPFYGFVCIKLVCDGFLRGCERMKYFMASTFTDLCLRVLLAFVLSPLFRETGIWFAWPISWIISTCMSYLFCIKTKKRNAA